MDKIEMIIQKYGDKIQVGYQTLRDQYIIYNILFIFEVVLFAGVIASAAILTTINLASENFDRNYFDKTDKYYYDAHKVERILVYLNIILPVVFFMLFLITLVLIGIFAPDYGFIKSLIGDN